jgi:tRNA pseudouridine65 synthase
MDDRTEFPAGECLYEDEALFVLYKPSGMLVHRGWGKAEEVLVDHARSRTQEGAAHPIQRLDRGASGPVLFAKNSDAAKLLSELAQAGQCRKDYLALVRGVAPEFLDIDHAISRREDGPRVDARTLVSRVLTAETEPRHCSLVVATPLTGRLHQIRRHLKHANYPLYGDGRYGRGDLNRAFAGTYGLCRLALHAYRWSVTSPLSGEVIQGVVPLPSDLAEPLHRMGFELRALHETVIALLNGMSV